MTPEIGGFEKTDLLVTLGKTGNREAKKCRTAGWKTNILQWGR
jgi:hypothetical protein